MLRSILKVIMSLVLCSCGGISDMQKNAKSASDNSDRAATAAEHSREEIANGRVLGRAGEASNARREALAAMMEAKSFEQKATEAAKFCKGFEYQMWTGQRYDNADSMEILMKDAMEEFFRAMVEINGNQDIVGYSFQPFYYNLMATDQENDERRSQELNVYTMAAAMHKVHHYSDMVGLEPPPSIYQILVDSLVEIRKVEKGEKALEELKPHEVIVYRHRDDTRALMQARVNMILIVALKLSTDIFESPSRLVMGAVNPTLIGWKETRFGYLNPAEKDYILEVFEYGKNTAEVLRQEGLVVQFYPALYAQYMALTTDSIQPDTVLSRKSEADQEANAQYIEGLQFFFPKAKLRQH